MAVNSDAVKLVSAVPSSFTKLMTEFSCACMASSSLRLLLAATSVQVVVTVASALVTVASTTASSVIEKAVVLTCRGRRTEGVCFSQGPPFLCTGGALAVHWRCSGNALPMQWRCRGDAATCIGRAWSLAGRTWVQVVPGARV